MAIKLVLYMLAISLSNQFCGINALLTYADLILADAGVPLQPQQTSYLSKNLRNRNFWPQKFTQKKRKSRQKQIRDKIA